MIKLTEAELAERAELIVVGTVTRMESKWTWHKLFNTDLIVTDVWISPAEYRKGFLDKQELIVRIDGGVVGDIGQWVEDEPEFKVGEKVLLYLRRSSEEGIFEVVGLSQGKATIDEQGRILLQGYSYQGEKRIPANMAYFINWDIPLNWWKAIRNAHTEWNNDASRFTFDCGGTIRKPGDVKDGWNVVSCANYGKTKWLARTRVTEFISEKIIIECDIIFNTYFLWSTTGASNAFDVQDCATHEFGHCLGLLDLGPGGDTELTMYIETSPGSTKRRTLEVGDRDGIRYIYDTTPVAPSNLIATCSGNNVTLNWKDNSDNEDGFKIERKRGASGSYSQIGTNNPNKTSYAYNDPGLTSGYTYYYRVCAYNGSLNSSYSNEVPICIVPPLDIVLIIDHSGSMGSYGYMEPAKNAAKTFVGFMQTNDQIGVVSFNEAAIVNFLLTLITSNATRVATQNAISAIYSEGSTSIGAGLQYGQIQLNARGRPNAPWAMVLLSDGEENTPPWVSAILPTIPANNDVYTIALGLSTGQDLLGKIALTTGGGYYFLPTTQGLQDIYNRIRSRITGQQTVWSGSQKISQGVTQSLQNIFIDASVSQATFSVTWSGSDIDLVLKTPDGTIINPDSATVDTNIEFVSGQTYEYYIINYPTPGEWEMQVTGVDIPSGSEDYTAMVTAYAGLKLQIAFDRTEYYNGQPILVSASLTEDGQPILNADITADVETPTINKVHRKMTPAPEKAQKLKDPRADRAKTLPSVINSIAKQKREALPMAITSIILYDDGMHGDSAANDGFYANYYQETQTEGSYTFTVHASGTNLSGQSFTREDKQSVYVRYVPDYDVGISAILPQVDSLDVGKEVYPKVVVQNLGQSAAPESCWVFLKAYKSIPSFDSSSFDRLCDYSDSLFAILPPGVEDTLSFAPHLVSNFDLNWFPPYQVVAYVKTPTDQNPANDSLTREFGVRARPYDTEVLRFNIDNGDTLPVRYAFKPGVMVANSPLGPKANFRVWVKIYTSSSALVYSKFADVSNMPPNSYRCLYPSSDFVATQSGLYRMEATIQNRFDFLPVNNKYTIEFYATQGVTNGIEELASPTSFRLFEARPNPFKKATDIKWQIPVKSKVKLSIYDGSGRAVKTHTGLYEPGYYTMIWDGTDNAGKRVASGVYFYELKTSSFEARKKLVLLR